MYVKISIGVIQQQKVFYTEAFAYYEKAQDVLGSRKSNAELWDLVNWELSTATFILAKQLQDCSSAEEVCFFEIYFFIQLLYLKLILLEKRFLGSYKILQ